MGKIKFVYFDIGGVLVNHMAALERVAEDLGVDEGLVKQVFSENADRLDREEISWGEFEKTLMEKLGTDKSLEADLAEFFVENFEKVESSHRLIGELEGRFEIGILSNVAREIFDLIEKKEKIPMMDYKAVIKSGEWKVIKPEEEIYQIGEVKAGFAGEEILFIDDKRVNVEEARALGWQAVQFDYKKAAEGVRKIRQRLG